MKILFMCVANSARSQLAEGLAKKMLPEAEVRSAGSDPSRLNPLAVEALKEEGVDISQHLSKSIDDLPPKFIVELDYIITLCAEEVCPTMVSQRAKKLHWPFPDPASREPLPKDAALRRFQEARDAIKQRLESFIKEVKNV